MASYIGNVPAAQATQTRQSITATAGQTSFGTAGYTPGYLDVYLNGVHLETTDYEATNGADIVLLSAAEADDILTYTSYTTVDLITFDNYALKSYVDTAVDNVDVTAELAQVTSDYQAADAANLSTAQAYTDSQDTKYVNDLTTAYTAADATNLQAAKDFTNTQVSSIIPTGGIADAEQTAGLIATAKSEAITSSNSYTDTAVAGLVDTAPAALNTLNELAAALGDDPSFATTVTNQIGTKADAVHGHAISDVTGLQSALNGKVDDSQVLTNVPAGAVFTDTVYTHPSAHSISMITGLQSALDGKVDDSQVLTNVPANAVFTDTVYSHPSSHPISMITGLQAVLDSKQATGDYALNSAIPTDVSQLADNAAILFSGSYLDLSDKPTIPEPAQQGVFFENDTTLTADYTITAGKNAMTAGPITIADGVTVTIPNGSTWTVV